VWKVLDPDPYLLDSLRHPLEKVAAEVAIEVSVGGHSSGLYVAAVAYWAAVAAAADAVSMIAVGVAAAGDWGFVEALVADVDLYCAREAVMVQTGEGAFQNLSTYQPLTYRIVVERV